MDTTDTPRELTFRQSLNRPRVGQMVRYVLPAGWRNAGEERAAMVVRVFAPLAGFEDECNLLVHKDVKDGEAERTWVQLKRLIGSQ